MKKEKHLRFKYIRELERFVNRLVDFFNRNEPNKNEIDHFIDKIFEPLENIQKCYLSSEYLKSLEDFVQRSANLHLSQQDAEQIKNDVLKEANLLRKLKRKKRFSKEKHKKSWQEA